MNEWLNSAFQQHTIAWLLISTILGGLAGSAITLFFEEVLRPHLAMRRELHQIYRKYRNHLLGSANSLERQINTIVRSQGESWLRNEYYRLSTFYKFGLFFCWVRQIESDVGFLNMHSSARAREFTLRLYGPFSGLSSIRRYFKGVEFAAETAIPRDITRAIGEEMMDTPQKINKFPSSPIGFAAFVRRYTNDQQFRRWFAGFDNLLEDISSTPKQVQIERLIITGAHIKLLSRFLDPRAIYTTENLANLDLIKRDDLRAQLRKDGILSEDL